MGCLGFSHNTMELGCMLDYCCELIVVLLYAVEDCFSFFLTESFLVSLLAFHTVLSEFALGNFTTDVYQKTFTLTPVI